MDGQGIVWGKQDQKAPIPIALLNDNFGQTDGRPIAYSERERKFTSAKNRCSWDRQTSQTNIPPRVPGNNLF